MSHGAGAPVAAVRAAWVLPIAQPPVRDGGLLCERGRLLAIGPWPRIEGIARERERAGTPVAWRDAGARAVLPGLVNAHTHLELGWLRGRLPAFATMPEWVQALVALRRREAADEVAASEAGVRECLACGTAAVGDVGNTAASCGPLAASRLQAVVFRELIGFDPPDPDALVSRALHEAARDAAPNLRVTVSAHAPYSVAPGLFDAIRRHVLAGPAPVLAVHLAESAEESRLLADGSGPWRDLLEQVGTWTPRWTPPRCSPVRYLERLGWLVPGAVLVHMVQASEADLERVAAAGASIVTCPRSNERLRVGVPPVVAFLASGANVAVGTDSLASNDDLNVFGELAALRRLAPHVPAARLLACATIGGARALRLDADLGTLEPGKRAAAIAVTVKAGDDVEERLVRGVDAGDIEWVAA